MPVILALWKRSLKLVELRTERRCLKAGRKLRTERPCLKAGSKPKRAKVRLTFRPSSWTGAKLLFMTCWAPGQEETHFSVYSDVICGHVLATFGLLLLSSNSERPGVACPSLPVRTNGHKIIKAVVHCES